MRIETIRKLFKKPDLWGIQKELSLGPRGRKEEEV